MCCDWYVRGLNNPYVVNIRARDFAKHTRAEASWKRGDYSIWQNEYVEVLKVSKGLNEALSTNGFACLGLYQFYPCLFFFLNHFLLFWFFVLVALSFCHFIPCYHDHSSCLSFCKCVLNRKKLCKTLIG